VTAIPTIPQCDEIERAVLGAMMLDSACIADMRAILAPVDFRLPVHVAIAQTIYDLADTGQAGDGVSFYDRLKDGDLLAEVGGATYLAEIFDSTPTTAYVLEHAQIVADRALRRDMMRRIHEAARDLHDHNTAGAVTLERLVNDLQEHAVRRTPDSGTVLAAALDEALSLSDDEKEGRAVYLPIAAVQRMVGGLRPGWQVILAGRTSSGKTSYALQIATQAANAGLPVLIFSLEMMTRELVRRLLSQASGCRIEITGDGVTVQPASRIEEFRAALERLRQLPITIDDTARLSLADIHARCERQKRRNGLGLVVVDYLQLMQSPKAENRTRELELMSRRSKLMAKALEVPVVTLSQLSREADRERRPRMGHLKGSGSLEQDADLILLVHRPDPQSPDADKRQEAYVIVEKNRHGPVGSVELAFEAYCTKFVDKGC